jgi:hypothetical protein
MAPDMGFVPRTPEYGSVKAKLLDARGDAIGITEGAPRRGLRQERTFGDRTVYPKRNVFNCNCR